ncbi:MAG: alpha/beta hydrolase [Chitinophagales bacterium]|jgi:pimeloyl-ACP methyl ester carboxylesterase|nr:alpha/beta hydrolase [Chitinophagales bacterium]
MDFQFVPTNGIRLHCATEGSGKLLVMLHGFPEFWYSWRHQIPFLANYYRVVAPDMRGYNLSDKPKGVRNYRTDILAADIKDLILQLGETKAYIVAHDWGGAVAWTLAALYPEVVEKMVILNMPHPLEFRRHLLRFNTEQWKKSWYIFFFQLPYLPERYLTKDLRTFFKKALRGWATRKEAFSDHDIDQYVAAYSQPGAFTPPINYYRAALRNSYPKAIPKTPIKPPVMLLWGEQDRALGKELTYNTPNYCERLRMQYLPDAGHWIQHDCPELVNSYIHEFFSQIEPQ